MSAAEADPAAGFRVERDSMGEVRVPADAKWGATTQRAIENFPVSGLRLARAHIEALGRIKAAAASANAELGILDADMAAAIRTAAEEVARGDWDDQFPIDIFQTGSGTSSNMNANEVIATLASERLGRPVHPNDHVNASQSSNDVFPSSIHLAAANGVVHQLIPALDHLAASLERKRDEFASVVKSGRTHLMDATPVTLGQEFGGYAAQVRRGIERLQASLPRIAELPLGGTAVGTGVNMPAGFASRVIADLAAQTRLPATEARDHFEAQGARDGLVEASGQLRTVAVSLYKISNDLRWMGSGPRTGLGEINLPDLQPGSSIMPGKVNPVIPEVVNQTSFLVIGLDVTVTLAASAGQLQLNVMEPVITFALFASIATMERAVDSLRVNCIHGITANTDRTRDMVLNSLGIVTMLKPSLGYKQCAEIARQGYETGKSLHDIVVKEKKLLTQQKWDEIFSFENLINPKFEQ